MIIDHNREGGTPDGRRGGHDFIDCPDGDISRPDVVKILDRRLLQRYTKLELMAFEQEHIERLWELRQLAYDTFPAWSPMTQSQCTAEIELRDGTKTICHTDLRPWTELCPSCGNPIPLSPQQVAWESLASLILLGGAAGGGKTGLLNGTAFMKARNMTFRRDDGTHLNGLFEKDWPFFTNKFKERAMGKGRWNFEQEGLFVTWGGLSTPQHKKAIQGDPNDHIGVDEVAQIEESYARWVMGWNRTTEGGEDLQTQTLMGSNPPIDKRGFWLYRKFYPWVRSELHLREPSGKVLYFMKTDDEASDETKQCEKDDFKEILLPNGKKRIVRPKSVTFVSMNVSDNYFLNEDYISTLDDLPPHIRKKMLKGIWTPDYDTEDYQVIPTEWVVAAQKRWTPHGWEYKKQSTVGADVGQSSEGDRTCITSRYDNWFSKIKVYKGKHVLMDGWFVADMIGHEVHEQFAPIYIDASNIGSSAFDILKKRYGENGKLRENGARGMVCNIISTYGAWCLAENGHMGFYNLRAQLWWKMRELLDPKNGHNIALPPDDELLSELTTPKYSIRGHWYIVQEKKEIKAQLNGQSTDKADSVILAAVGISCPHKLGVRQFVGETHRFDKDGKRVKKEPEKKEEAYLVNVRRSSRSVSGGAWAV